MLQKLFMMWLFQCQLHFLVHHYSGLKEYIGANPALKNESTTVVVHSKFSDVSSSNGYYEDVEVQEQFYDAIAADSSSSEDEDSDDSNDPDKKVFYFSPYFSLEIKFSLKGLEKDKSVTYDQI